MNAQPIRIEAARPAEVPYDALRALRRAAPPPRRRLSSSLATGLALLVALVSGIVTGLTVYFGSALIAMVLTGVLALTAVPLVSALFQPPRRGYVR